MMLLASEGVDTGFDFDAGVVEPVVGRPLGRKELAAPLPVLIVIIGEPGGLPFALAVGADALTHCASH